MSDQNKRKVGIGHRSPIGIFLNEKGLRPTSVTINYEDGSKQLIRPQSKEFLRYSRDINEWTKLVEGVAQGRKVTKFEVS